MAFDVFPEFERDQLFSVLSRIISLLKGRDDAEQNALHPQDSGVALLPCPTIRCLLVDMWRKQQEVPIEHGSARRCSSLHHLRRWIIAIHRFQ